MPTAVWMLQQPKEGEVPPGGSFLFNKAAPVKLLIFLCKELGFYNFILNDQIAREALYRFWSAFSVNSELV